MLKPILTLAVLVTVAACSSTITRLNMPNVVPTASVRSDVGSVMIRTVTLPTYAATEEISIETAPGVITTDGDLLAADDPVRGVTLALTQGVSEILDSTVGPDPWPFAGLPDVAVDVQVSEMLGSVVTDTFRLAGQYYVGGDGIDYPDRTYSFDFTVPMPTADIPGAVAAQGVAVAQLAEEIARSLGR
ncbi:PqiC family protein [Loktanella sp. DJP18]|uniref:PqiC family protein n=1 Tax=Loktanella sp. DJP18 TaxID=3409788 RepID=UPI003BB4BADA